MNKNINNPTISGWNVFAIDGDITQLQVQKDDRFDILSDDDAAIIKAREYGIECDDEGNLIYPLSVEMWQKLYETNMSTCFYEDEEE